MDKKQLLLFVSLPVITIFVFLGAKLYLASFGEEILLETSAVGSKDILGGGYGILDYEISMVNLNTSPHDYGFSKDESIYATLSKKEKFWSLDSISHTKPDLNENQVCMKGRVTSSYNNSLSVKWGIENYFVSGEKGEIIENSSNVSVIISVDSACSSVVKELLINNEPV